MRPLFAIAIATAAAAAVLPPCVTEAAIVDAGTVTTVSVSAPLYDTNLSDNYGCEPEGCVGDLTRDGDLTDLQSRWSCLHPWNSGNTCSITYTLADPLTIEGFKIALYKGDQRLRTLEIYIDGELATTWTSSGTTTDFETIDCSGTGSTIEVVGILGIREWIAIAELEILVDDSVLSTVVEAGTLGTVTTEAELFDYNLSDNYGCDPIGCVAANTRDGSHELQSRWSCRPWLGGPCTISYDLGALRHLSHLRLALYKGTTRTRTIEVYVDGVLATTWTSSGTTDYFEGVDVSGWCGKLIELVGVNLEPNEWISIIETEILVETNPAVDVVEIGTLTTVTTEAELFDYNLSDNYGCDPIGCVGPNTRDGSHELQSRWSCRPWLGGPCTISYDLGAEWQLSHLRLALYKGTTRTRTIEVYVDGVLATTWTSSGTTDDFESIDVSGWSGALIELTGVNLEPNEWISFIETEIMVFASCNDKVTSTSFSTPAPEYTPPPTPAMSTPSPLELSTTEPDGDLLIVGLIPLAEGTGDERDRFYVKDGNMETSWTCTGDPPSGSFYSCTLRLSLFSFRHIKQIKIASSGAVELRFAAWKPNTNGGPDNFKLFETVTSSGTGGALETYDVDYFTSRIEISPVFTTVGQTFTISEVEFVEELKPPPQLSISGYTVPISSSGPWNVATTDKFEWSSDSDEALDSDMTFKLDAYAIVTAVEFRFPVGETYKFDLQFFVDDDQQPTFGISGDPFLIIPGLESANTPHWQSFDISAECGDQYVTMINIVMKGTGSGADGWSVLDARIIGTPIENPSDVYNVGSTYIENWFTDRYPDFVTESTGDQKAIMSAICAVKKASFDGVDCVGEDPNATGTVHLPMGSFFVDGNIFMKSGVFLNGRYSDDDGPFTTDILLEQGAAGNTDIPAIVVMDGISNAVIDDLWIRGQYDPDTSNAFEAVPGLGSTCLSITNSQDVTCRDTEIRYCDGDAMVVRESTNVNIDAGEFDDEFRPWTIGISRGTGLLVDNCENVWVRRHTMYDNGVAGIHIIGSTNFTFEATITSEDDQPFPEGEGNVGSLDGQQPIEIIIESSSLVTFQDMKVTSSNDPVITISRDSLGIVFENCGFSSVESEVCVIEAGNICEVMADDDELMREPPCFVKV